MQFDKQKIKRELEARRQREYRKFKTGMILLFGNFYTNKNNSNK